MDSLNALSKTQLVEVHRKLFGFVGDSARKSKDDYIAAIAACGNAEKIAAAAASVVDSQQHGGDTEARESAAQESATVKPAQQRAVAMVPQEAAAQLLGIVQSLAGGMVNEDRVRQICDDAIAGALQNVKPLRIEVRGGGTVRKVEGAAHAKLPTLIKLLSANLQVWLSGPTGSGKTHAVEQAAAALGLPFYFNGAIDTEYKLLGFVDANGNVVSTAFREAFTNGGVYLFDEVDASLPAATLAFNAALSNGYADFPGGKVQRHPNFRAVAAANTWGLGATNDYVGRNRMDAAFLNRFVRVDWDYDSALEMALCGNPEWCAIVQDARKKARENGLRVVVSPRDSINGAAMLAIGFTTNDAIKMTFGAGLSPEQLRNLGV